MVLHEGGEGGVFVAVFFLGEAAQMGEGGENVVVHGVDVVEVVLQQPDDVVPLGQIAGEDAVEVEQA